MHTFRDRIVPWPAPRSAPGSALRNTKAGVDLRAPHSTVVRDTREDGPDETPDDAIVNERPNIFSPLGLP